MNVRYTLKKNSDFRRLYSKGKQAVVPSMVIYARKNRLENNRTGFTVSTKLGHAVDRNRMRRRLRAVYRVNEPKLKKGWDFVIVARSRSLNIKWEALNTQFTDACAKLGLIGEDHEKVSD